MPDFGDKFVLVTGIKNVMNVTKEYGFKKAIHVEELYALMPYLCPLIDYDYPMARRERNKVAVLERFGMTEDELVS